MNNQWNDMDWIEGFLEGSLNPDEVKAFHEKLQSDPAFARKYHSRLRLQLDWQSAATTADTFNRVKNAIRMEKSSGTRSRNFFLMAASVIILAGLVGILIYSLPDKGTRAPQEAGVIADSIDSIDSSSGPQRIGMPSYGKSDTIEKDGTRNMKLLSPSVGEQFVNGDTIHFQWDIASAGSELVIREKEKDSLVFRLKFNQNETSYDFVIKQMTAGTYYWYVNDPFISLEFVITSQNPDK